MKRRRRRERHDIAADAELGLAWYTREGWERLRELAVDREQLDDSFDAWERGAQAAIAELAAMGRVVRKVPRRSSPGAGCRIVTSIARRAPSTSRTCCSNDTNLRS